MKAIQDLGCGRKPSSVPAIHATQRPEVPSPPEACEVLPQAAPLFTKSALSPRTHRAARFSATPDEDFEALYAGPILPELYPIEKLHSSPGNCLLIANDVGLGKRTLLTVSAGPHREVQEETCLEGSPSPLHQLRTLRR